MASSQTYPATYFDEYLLHLTMDDEKFSSPTFLLQECAAQDFLLPHRHHSLPFDGSIIDAQAFTAAEPDWDLSSQSSDFDINDLASFQHNPPAALSPTLNLSLSTSVMDTHISQPFYLSPPSPPAYCKLRRMSSRCRVIDSSSGKSRSPFLFEFLRGMLEDESYADMISYTDREAGVFKLHQPDAVAQLWKSAKGRNSDNKMTYEKMARALRHYYRTDVIRSVPGRYTFRFGTGSGFRTTWWPVC